jgi:hypothetical protein
MNEHKIKKIELVLENCEVIDVPGDNIERFLTGQIKHGIHAQDNSCWTYYYTDYCSLKVKTKTDSFIWSNEGVSGEQTALGRLRLRDITNLDIIYDDDSHLYLGVPWRGFKDSYNKCEKWKITDDCYTIEWDDYSLTKKCKQLLSKVAYYLYCRLNIICRKRHLKR